MPQRHLFAVFLTIRRAAGTKNIAHFDSGLHDRTRSTESEAFAVEILQRAADCRQPPALYMQINRRRRWAAVPHQLLDVQDVAAGFQQMRRETVTQRVDGRFLGDPGL